MRVVDVRDFCIPSDENNYDELVEFADTMAAIPQFNAVSIDVIDKIRAEIEALPKIYPFINHIDTYVKEDDVKKIIDKYKTEGSDKE